MHNSTQLSWNVNESDSTPIISAILKSMDAMHVLNEFTKGETIEPGQPTDHRPFQMHEYQYMGYATIDLDRASRSEDPLHDLVNAVGNAKRALHCRVDTILDFWGIRSIASERRWGLPAKLAKLKQAGVTTPGLLERINKYRNDAEHEYEQADSATMTDFVEVVQLFLGASRKYIQTEIEATSETEVSREAGEKERERVWEQGGPKEEENPWPGAAREWVKFKLGRGKAEVTLDYCLPDTASGRRTKGVFVIKAADDMKMFLSALDAWHQRLEYESELVLAFAQENSARLLSVEN